MNLFSLLDQTATRYPEHGAVFHGLEQVLTWRELRSRIEPVCRHPAAMWGR